MFIKIKHIALFTVAFAVFGCSTDFTTNSDSGSFVEFAGLGAVDENDDGSLLLTWNPATAFSQFQYKIYFQEADNVDTSTMTPVGTVGARPVFRENFKTGEKTPFANGQLIATLSSDTTEFRLDNLLNSSKYYIVQVKVDLGDGKIDENHLVQVVGPRGDLTYKGCSVVEPGDNLGEIKIQVDVPLQASIVQILRDGTPIASSINNGVSTIVDRGLEDLSRDYTYLCVASVGDQTWLGEPSFSKPFNPLIGYEGCVSGKPLGSNVAQIDFDFPSLASGVKLYRNGVLAGAKTAASAPNEVGGIGKFVDTSLSEGITYQYECAATIGEYEIRGTKDQLITTLSSNPPTFSGIDSATYLTPKSAKLKWPVATGVIATSYKIYAQTGLAINPATPIATIEASTLEYEVTNLGDDLTYSFSVRACSDQGVCDNNIETITPTRETPNIDAGAPTSPGLTEAKLVNGQIKLTIPWEDSYGGVAKRNVYVFEGTTAGSNISQYSLSQTIAVPDPLNPPTEFLLSGINEGQQYQIIVRDEDVHGNINQNTVFQNVAVDDLTPPIFNGITNLSKGTTGNEDTEISIHLRTIELESVDPAGATSYEIYWKKGVFNACTEFDFKETILANTLPTNSDVTIVIDALTPKTLYSFCAKAADSEANISGNTTSDRRSTFDLVTPDFDGVQSLTFLPDQQVFRVEWNASTSNDVVRYEGEIWNQKNSAIRQPFELTVAQGSNINMTEIASSSISALDINAGDTVSVVVNACDNGNFLINTPDGQQNCTSFNDADSRNLTVADIEPPPGFNGVSSLLASPSQEGSLDVQWEVDAGTDWSDYGGFKIFLFDGDVDLATYTEEDLENIPTKTLDSFSCTVGDSSCEGGIAMPTRYQITGLNVNRTYQVHVRAFDKQIPANFTVLNIEVRSRSATTNDFTPPSFASTTLVQYNSNNRNVEINWSQEATDLQFSGDLTYHICRRATSPFDPASAQTCNGLHTIVDSTPNDLSDNTVFFDAENLESNQTYYYVICVEDASSPANRTCNPNTQSVTLPDIVPPIVKNFTSDKTETAKEWNLSWELSDPPSADITNLSVELFRGFSEDIPVVYQPNDITALSLAPLSNEIDASKESVTNTKGNPNKREWVNYILRVTDSGNNRSYATYSVLSDNELIGYQVSRTDGHPSGGETLAITGKGFIDDGTDKTLVEVDGNPCTNILVHGQTAITCTAPPGSIGVVDVALTNPDTSRYVIQGAYEYTLNSNNPCDQASSGGLFHSGSGDENDPYIICEPQHMINIDQVGNLQHFEMWDNLDFQNISKGCSTLRQGTRLNGNGHALLNFTGSNLCSSQAFFHTSSHDIVVKNFSMLNFDIGENVQSAFIRDAANTGCEEDQLQTNFENIFMQGKLRVEYASSSNNRQTLIGSLIAGHSLGGGFILKSTDTNPNVFDVNITGENGNHTLEEVGTIFGRSYCSTIHDTDIYIDISQGSASSVIYVGGVGGRMLSNSQAVINDFKNIRTFGSLTGDLRLGAGGIIGSFSKSVSSDTISIVKSDFENIENHININNTIATTGSSSTNGGIFGVYSGFGSFKNLRNFGNITASSTSLNVASLGGIAGVFSGRYSVTMSDGSPTVLANSIGEWENIQNHGDIKSFSSFSSLFLTRTSHVSANGFGGIFGRAVNSLLINAQNFGEITGNTSVGGLVGRAVPSYDDTSNPQTIAGIKDSLNYGSVGSSVGGTTFSGGGLIGTVQAPTFAPTDLSLLRFELHELQITNSHNHGDIFDQRSAGGLIGNTLRLSQTDYANYDQTVEFLVTINQSSFTPDINRENTTSINDVTGGFVGRLHHGDWLIKNSFVHANIGQTFISGGMVGEIKPTSGNVDIVNSYAATTFASTQNLGGLIPTVSSNTFGGNYTVSNSYWDTSLSGVSQTYQDKGLGLTTSQMTDINQFFGWDFINIWKEVTGTYPTLQ